MNSRTRSPENRDNLHTDTKLPEKIHEIPCISIIELSCLQGCMRTRTGQRDQAKTNNMSPDASWDNTDIGIYSLCSRIQA